MDSNWIERKKKGELKKRKRKLSKMWLNPNPLRCCFGFPFFFESGGAAAAVGRQWRTWCLAWSFFFFVCVPACSMVHPSTHTHSHTHTHTHTHRDTHTQRRGEWIHRTTHATLRPFKGTLWWNSVVVVVIYLFFFKFKLGLTEFVLFVFFLFLVSKALLGSLLAFCENVLRWSASPFRHFRWCLERG